MLDIVAFVPVLLTLVGAAMALWKTVRKWQARHNLSIAVHANSADLAEVRTQLDAKNIDAAAALVRKYVKTLPPAERREAESALGQPSLRGRAGYMRGVAGWSAVVPE